MMRRSAPATVSTWQSRITGPTCGWSTVLRADSWWPTAPESHSSANRSLRACSSPTSRRSLWSAGQRSAATRRSATGSASNARRDSGGVPHPGARAEQIAPHGVAVVAAPSRRVSHQRGVRRVGQEQGPGGVVDGDGGSGQPVQEPLDARGEAPGSGVRARRRQPGRPERMLALGPRQPQSPGQGLDDLGRGWDARPCSRRVMQSTEIPAGSTGSSRHRPGGRRRPPEGSPAASGGTRSRRRRTALPNSAVAMPPGVPRGARVFLVPAVPGRGGLWLCGGPRTTLEA